MQISRDMAIAYMNESPAYIIVLDENFKVIYANEIAFKLLGFKNYQNFKEAVDEYIGNAMLNAGNHKIAEYSDIYKALIKTKETGKATYAGEFSIERGTFYVNIEFNKVVVDGCTTFSLKRYELNENDLTRINLIRKDELLSSVNKIAEIVLNTDRSKFDVNIKKCLEILLEVANVNRVCLYENYVDSEGKVWAKENCEVIKDVEPTPENMREFCYEHMLDNWKEYFANDICINSKVKDLSINEQEVYFAQGIKSILLSSVYLDEDFWGFIGFDDCMVERRFTKDEEKILIAGVKLIVNAMQKSKLNKQLIEAKDLALSGTRAKSDFLSRMSHEIRTPLNAIIGMTRIARTSDDMEKIQSCLKKIHGSSNHLLSLINDILDMSKIEANKLQICEEVFDLEKILSNIMTLVSVRCDENSQNLFANIKPDVPKFLKGDSLRFAQVITNLANNASKFTPKYGDVTISIEKTGKVSDKCEIKVTVSDTGIGLTDEQIEKLFDPFEQADGGIARKYGGTGLGLAICKSIVELMGGTIYCESEFGAGSEFIFTVLMQEIESIKMNESLEQDIEQINIRDAKILLVDDSLETRESITSILVKAEINIEIADNGYDAYYMAEKAVKDNAPYDIIFLDWRMPNLDGLQTAQKIKDIPDIKSVIVLISAANWTDVRDDAQKFGITKYLPKPIFPSTLIKTIKEILVTQYADDFEVYEVETKLKLEHKTILLCEDVEINAEIIAAMLEETGVNILFAENGFQAVEMFKIYKDIDLILMDIQMPGLDGISATKEIRKLDFERAKTIPIIAMTANVFREDVEKCLNSGMDDHIPKPVDVDLLFEKISEYLTKKR